MFASLRGQTEIFARRAGTYAALPSTKFLRIHLAL